MICSECGHKESGVVDLKLTQEDFSRGYRRFVEVCKACGHSEEKRVRLASAGPVTVLSKWGPRHG